MLQIFTATNKIGRGSMLPVTVNTTCHALQLISQARELVQR
jgi:hypothetical protein